MPRFGDGGGERVWLNILARLDRTRWRPSLAFFEKTESHFLSEIPDDVAVYDLAKRRRALIELPRMVVRLARVLRRERPVAIVSMLHTWGFVLEAAQTVAGRRVPVLVNEHIHVGSSLAHLRRERPRLARAAPLLHRFAYRRAAGVIAIAEGQAAELRTEYRVPSDKLVVIPNGIDRARVRALAAERLPDPWLDEAPYAIAIGRLIPQKGFDDLLAAYALVEPRVAERLAIAGEGELRPELDQLVDSLSLRGRVKLLGRLENPFPALRQASAFVLSSRWEALPQVLVEALALGVPVISTDCPTGPREILVDGQYGVLVPPNDPGRLGTALAELLQDETLRTRLATDGPARAADFDVDVMVRRYEAELERVAR